MLAAQMSLRPDAEKLLAQAKELEDKAAALEANSRQPEETSAKRGLMAPTDARGVAERRFAFVDAVLGARAGAPGALPPSGGEAFGTADVQGDAGQLQVGAAADEAAVAHPAPAVAALQRAEGGLDLATDGREREVHPALPGRQAPARVAAVHDAGLGQHLAAAIAS